ncbi:MULTISPECIES: cbb3-type cytochrome oxidase subunit 3 [Chromobacterium]|uniref:Cbb3-type cytochrome c oxidase subunit 3 n=3 Tax=Chromobacterium TaxID=535 RepID=A0A1W0CSZ1_9NEIS|nr:MULTISPECIES: cbb3-type cytochrome c oxidase subunit 3 [Chromobacterium]AXT45394.1 CcoQ/FixQ family Cbb3-type cytochrome c oxidase assembly chaperone [Chromobacterium rhizoryzae]KMN76752.1 Cbb3-type cytochrome oxidase components FixQ/CcoQ [Chromobacterium sp. LK11]MBK0416864.1 cbb3-type cytochrome c oxidase subunit 3 [Chromobacterium haemolyticum]MBN3004571.1 cbb3-type cytochrome c oxidase subunit 3 [Chromobacterium alkanivorans]MBO0417011.1 cbb3-type cytochrome c oxidase subunit 3 [Chromob
MDWVTIGRSLFTVVCFAFFIVVLGIAYSKRSKNRYEDAANLPFLDDDKVQEAEQDQASNGAKK